MQNNEHEYKKSNQAYLKTPKNAGEPIYDKETGEIKTLKDGSPLCAPLFTVELNIVETLPVGKYEASIYEKEGQYGKYMGGKVQIKKEKPQYKNNYVRNVGNNSFMNKTQDNHNKAKADGYQPQNDQDDQILF